MNDPRKPMFDAARIAGDGTLNARDLAIVHAALDAAGVARAEAVMSNPGGMKIGAKGIALIQSFEGCAKQRPDGRIEAYPDPGSGGDPWTIGWGATGAGITRGTIWTRSQCDARFVEDMERYAADVRRALVNAPTTQDQFDALVSFHYNTGAIARATLTVRHKQGDYDGAAREFAKWSKAAGKTMAGLVRRRSAESALYRGDA